MEKDKIKEITRKAENRATLAEYCSALYRLVMEELPDGSYDIFSLQDTHSVAYADEIDGTKRINVVRFSAIQKAKGALRISWWKEAEGKNTYTVSPEFPENIPLLCDILDKCAQMGLIRSSAPYKQEFYEDSLFTVPKLSFVSDCAHTRLGVYHIEPDGPDTFCLRYTGEPSSFTRRNLRSKEDAADMARDHYIHSMIRKGYLKRES